MSFLGKEGGEGDASGLCTARTPVSTDARTHLDTVPMNLTMDTYHSGIYQVHHGSVLQESSVCPGTNLKLVGGGRSSSSAGSAIVCEVSVCEGRGKILLQDFLSVGFLSGEFTKATWRRVRQW